METNKYVKLAEVILNNLLEGIIKYQVVVLPKTFAHKTEVCFMAEDCYRSISIYKKDDNYKIQFYSSSRQDVESDISETDYHRLMVLVNNIEIRAKNTHFEELNNLFTESENID
jgi:hypothetical protein